MFTRLSYISGFLIVCVLLLTSVYLQFYQGQEPCPLCALQRVMFGFLGIWFFLGLLVQRNHIGRLIINFLCGITSLMGLALAGRQIWLQLYPPVNGGECGVSLQYLYNMLPLTSFMQHILQGSAECANRGWEFLYLNMAEWSFTWFLLFLALSACLLFEELRWNHHK